MLARAPITSEEYLAFPDEFEPNGNRIRDELISGELVEAPPSFELHNVVKSNILEVLITFVVANPHLGIKVLSEMAFVVNDHDNIRSRR
jgi:Putative restriction endonuclease